MGRRSERTSAAHGSSRYRSISTTTPRPSQIPGPDGGHSPLRCASTMLAAIAPAASTTSSTTIHRTLAGTRRHGRSTILDESPLPARAWRGLDERACRGSVERACRGVVTATW